MYSIEQHIYEAGWAIIVACWLTGVIATFMLGSFALIHPQSFLYVNRRMSHWVNFKYESTLSDTHDIDRFVYRHHYAVGFSFVIGASVMLYYAIFSINHNALLLALDFMGSYFWSVLFVKSIFGYIYIIGVLVLLIGTVVFVRPSELKKIEAWANYWVTSNDSIQVLNKSYSVFDHWVQQNTRVFGVLVLCGAVLVSCIILPMGI